MSDQTSLSQSVLTERSVSTEGAESLYFCPGESHPIPRSVHLARLAAFYPKCRNCPLRNDTGHLPRQTVERLQSTERRVERKSLLTTDGVRGIYLNELTRFRAAEMAAAFARNLWETARVAGRRDSGRKGHRRNRPTVVVGHDERPSSPDIVTGVAQALRRMGCAVIDVGLVTKPIFWFAADHLGTSAGVFVTGAGCDPSWTGLDFLGPGALPLSRGAGLDRVEERSGQSVSRPARKAGEQRTFQPRVPYEAGLWKHFHALRPLTICYATPVRQIDGLLGRLFARLPCRLNRVDVPHRARDVTEPADPDVRRLGEAVRSRDAHLGLLIDDDGMRCAFLDERGALVPPVQVTRLIAEVVLEEQPGTAVAVESAAREFLHDPVAAFDGRCVDGGTTQAAMSTAIREHAAVCGGGASGRHWIRESFPACDAVVTLAKVLAALSRSDAPFSQVAASSSSVSS